MQFPVEELRHNSIMSSWLHSCMTKPAEDGMKRDVLVISGGILTVGLCFWAFWGNPEKVPRDRHVQSLDADPNLKQVTERSPYMRTER